MLTVPLYQKLSELVPKGEPFAIAFSGGSDSTALVHALKDHPQARFVYSVDHNLRDGSKVEAQAAQDFALKCGYDAKVLIWRHMSSPTSAIQEKARKARYGLMGDQCRKEGIKYLLTAHSEDDQAETLLMRYDRKTDWRGAAGMAELTYGPVWPELAMVNVVRPLLEVSRKALRDYNLAHDLNWVEDPSNENRDYTRIRARDYLGERPSLRSHLLDTAKDLRLAINEEKTLIHDEAKAIVQVDENGEIILSDRPRPELMFHCLRAASGQGYPIDRAKLKKLRRKMAQEDFKSATLAGALISKYGSGFRIGRDPVAVTGRKDLNLDPQANPIELDSRFKIWDGRWGFKSDVPDISVVSQYSLTNPRDSRAPAHKITQPVLRQKRGDDADYHLFDNLQIEGVGAICLVKARLDAALGIKTP